MICSRVLYRVPCFHFSSFAGLWGEWPSPFMSRNLVLTRYRTVVFSVYSHGVRHIAEQQRPGELDEPMRILRPSPVGCMLEEVVRPSNAIHLAPLCEELSWHFMQPAGVHDQEHSRRRLISRHNIRRSAVQAQYRGYPRVGERPAGGMPQRRFWSHTRAVPSQPSRWVWLCGTLRETNFEIRVFCRYPRVNLNGCIFRPFSDRPTQPAFSESPWSGSVPRTPAQRVLGGLSRGRR